MFIGTFSQVQKQSITALKVNHDIIYTFVETQYDFVKDFKEVHVIVTKVLFFKLKEKVSFVFKHIYCNGTVIKPERGR